MDIKVIGDHIEITPAIDEYVKKKFLTLTIPDKISQVEFRIGNENKLEQYVQFNAHIQHQNINIKVKNDNAYKCIDSLMTKIHRHFVKIKEKSHIPTHKFT